MEVVAKRLRWLLGARQRYKHPELWELYLEDQRLPLILKKVLSEELHVPWMLGLTLARFSAS